MELMTCSELTIFPCYVGPDFDMGAFHLMVNRLADIMQESCAFRQDNINAKLGSHYSRKMGYFDACFSTFCP